MRIPRTCIGLSFLALHEAAYVSFAIWTCFYPWYSILMIPYTIHAICTPYYTFPNYRRLTILNIALSVLYATSIIPITYMYQELHDHYPDYMTVGAILACGFQLLFVFCFIRKEQLYPFYTYHPIADIDV